MKKSLARLNFYNIKKIPKFKYGTEWRTPTIDLEPNNWTILISFIEELQSNNTAMADIKCFSNAEDIIHIEGNKFRLFGGNQFECECEVIKTY